MHVLVVGGAGYIGSFVARELAARGHVRALEWLEAHPGEALVCNSGAVAGRR